MRPTTTTTTTTTTRPTETATPSDGDPRSVQTAALSDGGAITIWGPTEKNFGRAGQSVANIIGNVNHNGLDRLTISVNGARATDLPIGPSRGRLVASGDFNAEIPFDELKPGDNTIELVARYDSGITYRESTLIDYEPSFQADLPLEIDWSDGFSPFAQVVDGDWAIDSQGRLYPVHTGYDRLVTVGDLSWTDFELTTTLTVTEVKTGALAGVGLRWRGHEQVGDESPALGFWNVGAYLWHRFGDDSRLDAFGDDWSPSNSKPFTLSTGREYTMKSRVETVAEGTDYRMKMWPSGSDEPDEWQVQIVDEDKDSGSVVLIAHQAVVRFGNVLVEPLD